MGKLTAREVAAAKHPGARPGTKPRPVTFPDGDGLFLQITPGGSKSWLLRYTLAGRTREAGLGSYGDPPEGVTLAAAREKAAELRALARTGADPVDARREAQRQAAAAARKALAHTFRSLAEACIAAREAEWKNPIHRAQWRSTLETYAYPSLGETPIAEIGTDDVLAVLRPIWASKPETASRLRGRMEAVFDYAAALGFRPRGFNPAAWRGNLKPLLGSPNKLKARLRETTGEDGHHPALPYKRIGAFMAALAERPATTALALRFAILTAARTGEVLGARWREIDMDEAMWIVPAARMKAGREHRIPLSPAAMAILQGLLPENGEADPEDWIFKSGAGGALSQMSMLMLLRRMNEGESGPQWVDAAGRPITAHGFRSTCRDWVGEEASFPLEIAEAALAHTIRDKAQAAYERGDKLAKRRKMMEAWAAYCARPAAAGAGKVVRLRKREASA
ncbi:tyrosine-type recombinase/integrase [Roseicella aerolata]|uniref:Integrase arm-type DNA-binding domain-containing protein n=1 Tax=Roseicella aerolata TaxID=2883479 RepID=A0A9X1IAK5_9PROT|nr:site-specific integrase [Roseicella aerolata]MCB4820756.1 integrase arm-type DNA-binding domain-containing protein [Roseicella aerolata]